MSCSIMVIPYNFKIRKKSDVNTFIDDCMCKNNRYCILFESEKQLILEKDKDGDISVDLRYGNLDDIFNPSIEVARTKDNCYKETVQDYIWKYRKVINNEWFNKKGW